jgi:hypothetical protein
VGNNFDLSQGCGRKGCEPRVDVRLDHDARSGHFVGHLPRQREGLYEVTVSAAGVPGGGDLTAGDTIAVLDMGRA